MLDIIVGIVIAMAAGYNLANAIYICALYDLINDKKGDK